MNGKILYMALLLTVSAAGNESAENMRGIEFCFPTAARLLTPRPCSSVVLHIKIGRKYRPIYLFFTNSPIVNCFRINLRLPFTLHCGRGRRAHPDQVHHN